MAITATNLNEKINELKNIEATLKQHEDRAISLESALDEAKRTVSGVKNGISEVNNIIAASGSVTLQGAQAFISRLTTVGYNASALIPMLDQNINRIDEMKRELMAIKDTMQKMKSLLA